MIKHFFQYHMGYPMTSLGNVITYVISLIIGIGLIRIFFGANILVMIFGLVAMSTTFILLSMSGERKMRAWLIRLLAGRSSIFINCAAVGEGIRITTSGPRPIIHGNRIMDTKK